MNISERIRQPQPSSQHCSTRGTRRTRVYQRRDSESRAAQPEKQPATCGDPVLPFGNVSQPLSLSTSHRRAPYIHGASRRRSPARPAATEGAGQHTASSRPAAGDVLITANDAVRRGSTRHTALHEPATPRALLREPVGSPVVSVLPAGPMSSNPPDRSFPFSNTEGRPRRPSGSAQPIADSRRTHRGRSRDRTGAQDSAVSFRTQPPADR